MISAIPGKQMLVDRVWIQRYGKVSWVIGFVAGMLVNDTDA